MTDMNKGEMCMSCKMGMCAYCTMTNCKCATDDITKQVHKKLEGLKK